MDRCGQGRAAVIAGVVTVVVAMAAGPPVATAAATGEATGPQVQEAVDELLALPYDPSTLPTGIDAGFGEDDYPGAFPVTDTTTGDCCVGPVPDQPPLADLAPPFPRFPAGFDLVEFTSFDGTPLHAYVAIEPDAPGVVVMHGFNTNGKHSIVRYAAALHANGFSVIAPDHRDMGREWERGGSWHPDGRRGQTLGWKEAEDLLAAAGELRRRGVDRIGVLGFSEGAQNTILALGRDHDGLIDAAMTFSGPADQATLAQRNAASTAALLTTVVNNPDLCGYLADVGDLEEFRASPNFMLRHASAIDTLDGVIGTGVAVPAVHFYADDDELVPSWNATMLASRTQALPTQATVLVDLGNHAYFYDRWWTQAAALDWFQRWLDPDQSTATEPTVAQPLLGQPMREHMIDLSGTTREAGDAERERLDACPPAVAPIGPTILFEVDGAGSSRTVDLRRSYSGWDDHEIVSWRLDPGDGSAAVHGTDVAAARVAHRFTRPGRHRMRMTVTDDTGRTATATHVVEIAGADPTPAPTSPNGPTDGGSEAGTEDDRGVLPVTGGGPVVIGVVLLLAWMIVTGPLDVWHRRRQRATLDAGPTVP